MGDIRKKIGIGVFYTALSRYSSVFVTIILSATLSRLLTPKEFGVVAIILVFISFFNLLSSFGIGAAIVQNKSLSDDDISSIFSFSLVLGLMLSIIFYLVAPYISSFYNEPVLKNLSRLMALTILLNSIQIVPNALTLKKLKFKEIGIINVAVHIISGIVAIVLAYLGFSYYALIINSIVSASLFFISYFYLSPVKPSVRVQFSSIKKIIKFSTFQFLFQFINYFAGNTDNLLIGKYFSAVALGFYDKAYRLMLMPVQNLTYVITPVLHPVFSDYQDDNKTIYEAYIQIVKLLALVGFPLAVLLHFSSSEIINILFGSQWNQSIPVFQILAFVAGIQIVLSSTGSIFQATNRTDLLFISGLLSTILMIAGIAFGVFIGKELTAIGYGILIAITINVFQAFYLVVKVALNKSFSKFLNVFLFPIILSLGIALALWLASNLVINNIILSFVFKVCVAFATFTLILFKSRANWLFIKKNLTKMFSR